MFLNNISLIVVTRNMVPMGVMELLLQPTLDTGQRISLVLPMKTNMDTKRVLITINVLQIYLGLSLVLR